MIKRENSTFLRTTQNDDMAHANIKYESMMNGLDGPLRDIDFHPKRRKTIEQKLQYRT